MISEEAREARNAYRREWARRNPDRIKEHQERYWTKKAAARQSADNSRE